MFHLAEFPKTAMSGNPYAKKRKILKAILWRHESYSSFLSHEMALKRGFSLDGKNPFLRLIERCIKIQKHVYFEGNQGFAREGKILEFSYYPINKEFLRFHMPVFQPHRSGDVLFIQIPQWRKSKLKETGNPLS